MCCFSSTVEVEDTAIFARDAGDGRQFIVYSMNVENDKDTAMVLPLPVPKGTDEKAMKFIDLSAYPDFFIHLHKIFEVPLPPGTFLLSPPGAGDAKVLTVHAVGAFEASFVPTIGDFSRLDARFRIPAETWEKLPGYQDFGFAVFKLKPGKGSVHPMAFSFPRKDRASLFFPTVHIHDGTVKDEALFDHTLFAQLGKQHVIEFSEEWQESPGHPKGSVIDLKRTAGIIAPDEHVFRLYLKALLPNRDTILKFG